jgi:hypothetical protein
MKIVYNFATRSRPEKCLNVIRNIFQSSLHENYSIVITADVDDPTMNNRDMINKINSFPKTKIFFGFSKSKIDAINKNIGLLGDFDILVNISDDQLFIMKGFDQEIIKDMQEYFPDGDGFLHYPDSHAKDKLPTMSIMGKKYLDRFGYIYHPSYVNVYCDNEAMEVAIILGKHKFIDKNIYDHFHPVWGMAEWDEQYRKSENVISYATDRATYDERKANNFYL